MALTPLIMTIHERVVRPRFSSRLKPPPADTIEKNDHGVIIAGFGRFGQVVGRLLIANGIRPTVLEQDAAQIEILRRFGFKVFYGNAGRLELLQAAGAEEARLLILALDDAEVTLQIAEEVRRNFPKLTILARARDRTHAYELMRRGVTLVIRETFGSAMDMGQEALRQLGFRPHRANRLARLFRQHDERAMKEMFNISGDEKAYILESRRQFELVAQVMQNDKEEAAEESEPDENSPTR
jgi:voltage-gated potassium channel Kch